MARDVDGTAHVTFQSQKGFSHGSEDFPLPSPSAPDKSRPCYVSKVSDKVLLSIFSFAY